MVRINWTKQAKIDLKSIGDFIAINSPNFAKYYVKSIKSKTNLIKDFPQIGRTVPEFDKQNIKEIIFGNYRIIYHKLNEYRIDILTIHHSARILDILS
jgi:toxin ParE1/3/4